MSATTKIFSLVTSSRLEELERYKTHTESIQREQLRHLVDQAAETEWGCLHRFCDIDSYEQFKKNVPLQSYESLKPFIARMLEGENNVLWNTPIKWFAKSSGTTNDKSKFIPVSDESLDKCHYQGGKDAVILYLQINPDSSFFSGKGLILGGSHRPSEVAEGINCGDLSAVLLENLNFLVNIFFRVPDKMIALMDEWESKLEKICETTVEENVTNISGVPSWFLVLIKKLLEREGKDNLLEIWPNIEVFFHGGINFEPYREEYKKLIPSDNMYYIETYNASEGFFGIQNDLSEQTMMLMIDYGIFFEFIPMEDVEKENPRVFPLWEVELDKNYAIVISTNSGLWRYIIGDTIKFTSKNPYKFVITGRTKHFINAFGEELMVANADKGIAKACKETGAIVKDYTVAPTFMSDKQKGHHTWLIEFYKKPDNIEQFAEILDIELQNVNSDYEAKRYKGIFLSQLELITARENLFYDWFDKKGKLGGQHKVPRLSNNRTYLEELLSMNLES